MWSCKAAAAAAATQRGRRTLELDGVCLDFQRTALADKKVDEWIGNRKNNCAGQDTMFSSQDEGTSIPNLAVAGMHAGKKHILEVENIILQNNNTR